MKFLFLKVLKKVFDKLEEEGCIPNVYLAMKSCYNTKVCLKCIKVYLKLKII